MGRVHQEDKLISCPAETEKLKMRQACASPHDPGESALPHEAAMTCKNPYMDATDSETDLYRLKLG